MATSSTALPSAWVERLFSRFQAVYGNRLQSMWRDANPIEVKAVWADELGHYEAPDIKRALETMMLAYTDFPPTLPQFLAMCRDARKARTQVTNRVEYVRYGGASSEVLAAIHELTRDPGQRKRDPRDWARRILQRDSEGERMPVCALQSARAALGMAAVGDEHG